MKKSSIMLFISLAMFACSSEISYKTEDVQALAQSVKAHEITLYGTADCIYCTQAKQWLNQNQFAFTDCDINNNAQCAAQFKHHQGYGTPLIVIQRHGKQHIMRNGFDSDEFLLALQSGK